MIRHADPAPDQPATDASLDGLRTDERPLPTPAERESIAARAIARAHAERAAFYAALGPIVWRFVADRLTRLVDPAGRRSAG